MGIPPTSQPGRRAPRAFWSRPVRRALPVQCRLVPQSLPRTTWTPAALRVLCTLAAVGVVGLGFVTWRVPDLFNPFWPRLVFAGIGLGLVVGSKVDPRVEHHLQDLSLGLVALLFAYFSFAAWMHDLLVDDFIGMLPIIVVGGTLVRTRVQLIGMIALGVLAFGAIGLTVPEPSFPVPIAIALHALLIAGLGLAALAQLELRREVARTNQSLEAQVADRTSKLQASLDRLRSEVEVRKQAEAHAVAASQAKSSFLMKMSHELRTPLTAILGYTELIGEDLEDLVPDAPCREDLGRVEQSAEQLLTLIDQLLDLTRVESGQADYAPTQVDVNEVVRSTLAEHPPSPRRGNTVQTELEDGLPTIECDPRWLAEVMANLVDNAGKFTERGTVTVRTSRDAEHLHIEVEDTGIGMPAEALSTIFDRFAQVDSSTTRRHGGAGLGLALCRELVALMGGRIQVRSVLDQGSTFTVSLPLHRDPAPAA